MSYSKHRDFLPSDVRTKDINTTPPGIRDPSRRRIWTPVAKDWAFFEKYGRETNGNYTLMTVGVAPGGENAAHVHRTMRETFTSRTGRVGVFSEATGKIMLAPGESATVPAGMVHYFFNPGEEEVEMQIRLEPAREGFEKSLYLLYGLARDGKSANGGIPNSLMHCALIFTMGDVWPAGLAGAIAMPFLKVLAFFGRLSGVEDRLIKRYWA